MIWLPVKVEEGGYMPVYSTKGSAAMDLYSPVSGRIVPDSNLVVPLDIRMEIPQGYCGILTHRSGMNVKGISAYGIIDSDYRGIVKATLFNNSCHVYWFNRGDRIAQLQIIRLPELQLIEVQEMSLETQRGEGGHGSTGV